MYGKKKKKSESMKRMYQGGGIEGGVVDMFKKGGVETRSVQRPKACMKKRK
jgi:hypothetical protein